MAPSFAALRSRRQDRRADLDQRYGDISISAPNEGATWVEWNSPLASPEPKRSPSPPSASPKRHEEAKASITITINLPWQKKSRSRSASLPPDNRRKANPPTSTVMRHASQASRQPSRPNMALPAHNQTPAGSPSLQQGGTRRSAERSSRRPPSPVSSGTPALSILSPLTECFDEPQTPASATSDFLTSFENSPSSPVRYAAVEDEFTFLHPRKSPTPQASSRSPYLGARPSRELNSPPHSPLIPVNYHSSRRSPPLNKPTRRAQSVDPAIHRRRASDESDCWHYRVSGNPSDADDDVNTVKHRQATEAVRRSLGSSDQCQNRSHSKTERHHPGTYEQVTKDYSRIIRAVEADNRAGSNSLQPQPQGRTTTSRKTQPEQLRRAGLQPGSAGSGFSSTTDEGYSSGPQILVPSDEDLWG